MATLKESDLYEYQRRAVDFIKDSNSSMLWLDVGLGKTISALTATERLLDEYKISAALVIAPIKVIEAVWRQEALKWEHTKRLSFSLVRGKPQERLKALLTPSDIYLINYEQLQWLSTTLKETFLDRGISLPFDMVVLDEISKMKAATTKRVRAFTKILPHFVYRTGLTGTPATNGVIDLHGQYLVVDGGHRLGPNVTGFRSRWFMQDMYSMKWSPRRGAIQEIQDRIKDITLEMKADDYLELPPMVTKDLVLEMPEAAMVQYKEFEKEFFTVLDGSEVEAFSAGAKSMKCRQLANGAIYHDDARNWKVLHDSKIDALKEIIDELNGSPALICYQFVHDKERILREFPEAQVLDATNVTAKVDNWNSGKIKILVGHPLAMSHGLNLQHGGNNIIWFGLPWALEQYIQAIGRLLRNGQKGKAVIVHRLISKGTIEEAVMKALEAKELTQESLRDAIKQYRLTRGNNESST